MGVSYGIVNCFLTYSQEIVFNQPRERPERAADFHLSLHGGLRGQATRSLRQGRWQVVGVESLRAQIPNITAGFGDAMADQHSHPVQMSLGQRR